MVGAVTLGAVTATLVAAPAVADDPQYPSWGDVQRAKADRSAAEAESARITGLLGGLQDKADAAGRTAAIAAERFHRAKLAEDTARDRHRALAAHADAAAATARTSRMRAGLLAASVARGGGTDLQLMLDAGGANDFLHRLATVSQLSAQSQAITQRALADENEARALGEQADSAADVLARSAAAAKAALDEAQQAATVAAQAVGAEQQHADRLVAQLAELRGTSKRMAAQYAAGVRAEQADSTPSGGGSVAPVDPVAPPASGGGGASGGSSSAPVAPPSSRPTPSTGAVSGRSPSASASRSRAASSTSAPSQVRPVPPADTSSVRGDRPTCRCPR